MPKYSIMLNAQQIIEKFCEASDLADSIMEYAPDFDFPNNADPDSIDFNEVTYDASGNAIFTFDYTEEEDEDEDEDDSQSPDGSEGEDL